MGFDKKRVFPLGFYFPHAMHDTVVDKRDWFKHLSNEGFDPSNHSLKRLFNSEFVFSVYHNGSETDLVTVTKWLRRCADQRGQHHPDWSRLGMAFVFLEEHWKIFKDNEMSGFNAHCWDRWQYLEGSSGVGAGLSVVYVTNENMKDFLNKLIRHFSMDWMFKEPSDKLPFRVGSSSAAPTPTPAPQPQPQPQPQPHPHPHPPGPGDLYPPGPGHHHPPGPGPGPGHHHPPGPGPHHHPPGPGHPHHYPPPGHPHHPPGPGPGPAGHYPPGPAGHHPPGPNPYAGYAPGPQGHPAYPPPGYAAPGPFGSAPPPPY